MDKNGVILLQHLHKQLQNPLGGDDHMLDVIAQAPISHKTDLACVLVKYLRNFGP